MMRASILVIGALACVLAIKVNSLYGLFYLSADLVYVMFFPALLSSIYIPIVNTPGIMSGYVVALVLR